MEFLGYYFPSLFYYRLATERFLPRVQGTASPPVSLRHFLLSVGLREQQPHQKIIINEIRAQPSRLPSALPPFSRAQGTAAAHLLFSNKTKYAP